MHVYNYWQKYQSTPKIEISLLIFIPYSGKVVMNNITKKSKKSTSIDIIFKLATCYNVHNVNTFLNMKRSTFIIQWILYTVLILSLYGCIEFSNTYNVIAPGPWRGTLDLRSQTLITFSEEDASEKLAPDEFDFDKTPSGVLPFNFNVEYSSEDSIIITLINGEEIITVQDYKYTPDVLGEKDSLVIDFPIYDSHIEALLQEGIMQGYWVVHYRNNYKIPFKAKLGEDFRFFSIHEKPAHNISGRWEVHFEEEDGNKFPAIGDFVQKGNQLTGTFETETGDYRFLEGTVENDRFYLSTFDGAHAYLFEGKIIEKDSIIGSFYSGKHYRSTWYASLNSEAKLTDPESLSRAATDYPVNYSATTIDGKHISFNNPPYSDKVKVVQIMGTWCPNCYDETRFLKQWKKDNPNLPVEIVSLAFENYNYPESIKQIRTYRDRMAIPWPIIYGGNRNHTTPTQLNFIDKIVSYPTLVIFNKENYIEKVHTGFYGPATSQYEKFVHNFDQTIRSLIGN